MFVAAEIGSKRLIRALLDHGATIDTFCKDHWTLDVDTTQHLLDTAVIEIESHVPRHPRPYPLPPNLPRRILQRCLHLTRLRRGYPRPIGNWWMAAHPLRSAIAQRARRPALSPPRGGSQRPHTRHANYACRNGNEKTVQLLLSHNEDFMAIDERDWRPLHNAAQDIGRS